MRPIDAEAVKDVIAELNENGYDISPSDLAFVRNILLRMPTIEPKKGKWVERGENDDGTHNIQCSACEAGYKSKGHANSIYTKQRFHFCPNCGARMDADEWEEPEINPCRGCDDYDGRGGCKSHGGCGAERSEE